ncbi:MAG: WYL domain-containing protein [Muribaculaceae bacterium]|nr:WYL domain-containing protein [Muribaculaceae bacterium]
MNKQQILRYVWLADTLRAHRRLTKERLNQLWMKSELSDGNPLPDRTFYHYRRAVEEIFKIEIGCNSQGEYFIVENDEGGRSGMTDWLLDSFAINTLLADSSDIAGRVEVEEVPSAREFLPAVINAMRGGKSVIFDYAGFNRSMIERGIEFLPYFLKRYKQRWYMAGVRVKSGDIRTYALDRVKAMRPGEKSYELPADASAADIFGDIIGITSSKADARTVRLRATRTQAKYFRALPFHTSQKEELTADDHSEFTYRLKLNYELVHELVGLGDAVEVLEPKELRIMVAEELKKALKQYE